MPSRIPLDRKRLRCPAALGERTAGETVFRRDSGCRAAARSWGRITSVIPRAFGGNIDNKELVAGTTLYLPVFNTGALLSLGAGPALQGDGEVCRPAIEPALTGRIEIHLRKDLSFKRPHAETPQRWITMAFDEDLDDAVKQALRDMIVLIGALSGLFNGRMPTRFVQHRRRPSRYADRRRR